MSNHRDRYRQIAETLSRHGLGFPTTKAEAWLLVVALLLLVQSAVCPGSSARSHSQDKRESRDLETAARAQLSGRPVTEHVLAAFTVSTN
jgi:hypothetical protein